MSSIGKCLLVVLAICVLPFSLAAQQGGPGYVADARNGCKLWVGNVAAFKTVRWEGACKVGFASGSGRYQITSTSGHIFSGEADYVDGKRNGRGFFVTPYARYEGLFRDDKMNGRGWVTMSAEFAGERYDGDFRDNLFHGRGVYTWPDGSRLEAAFENGKPTGTGVYRHKSGRVVSGALKGGGYCLHAGGEVIQLGIAGLSSVC